MRAIEVTGGAMSPDQAAAYVGMSRATIMEAIHSAGGVDDVPPLAAKRVGRRYLILRSDLDRWLHDLPEA